MTFARNWMGLEINHDKQNKYRVLSHQLELKYVCLCVSLNWTGNHEKITTEGRRKKEGPGEHMGHKRHCASGELCRGKKESNQR